MGEKTGNKSRQCGKRKKARTPNRNGKLTKVCFVYDEKTRMLEVREKNEKGNPVYIDQGFKPADAKWRKRTIAAIKKKLPHLDEKGADDRLQKKAKELFESQVQEAAQYNQDHASNTPTDVTERAGEYYVANGCIHRELNTRDGKVGITLCNFDAKITKQVIQDDGAETTTYLTIEGKLYDGTPLPSVEVPAAQFGSMGWTMEKWGMHPVVNAGQSIKDHLRAGIQMLSGRTPTVAVYAHLGWREIAGKWSYLHAGGAIGAEGLVDSVTVRLPPALNRFLLPTPPQSSDRIIPILASHRFLELAPKCITFPVLMAAIRAALGQCDFSLHLVGPSGAFKSELAALAQQHYGSEMTRLNLPTAWCSTANANEALAFACKDALLTVDDFCPSGNSADQQRYHREADRLLRAQGNSAGRQRCRPDGSTRPPRQPRGLILSTGEDTPRGQSLQARLLIIEIAKGDIDRVRLTACQKDAAAGFYAQAMAAFLQWLAPQYAEILAERKQVVAKLRDEVLRESGLHARTPGIVAELLYAWRLWLRFAQEAGAITSSEQDKLDREGKAALCEAAKAQAIHQEQSEPTGHFLRLLSACISSGTAHIANTKGHEPTSPVSWGWRWEEDQRDGENGVWRPQGRRVGWLDGDNLYLEPEAAYAEAQRLAATKGEGLAVTSVTLWKRFKDKNLLASHDKDKNTIKRDLMGQRPRVLHLRADVLMTALDNGECTKEANT
jgi:hypothetical protein